MCNRNGRGRRCPDHPHNGGDCERHWLCDQLDEWEAMDRMKHDEKATGRRHINRLRPTPFGMVEA